jgi:hypothetical protein
LNDKVKEDEMGRVRKTNGGRRDVGMSCVCKDNRILVGKPEGKRPLGRPRRSWEVNTKIDFRETGWNGMDWIDLA